MIIYLKIAIRNIKKSLAYSLLNILGLSVGMACAFLILLWVQDELSFDKSFEKGDNLYRVLENQHYSGGEIFPVAVTPSGLAPVLKEEIPEIINSTRFTDRNWLIKKDEEYINEEIVLVDQDFLQMFEVEFLYGDIISALENPHSIILTKDLAQKYFEEDSPIGKTLEIDKTQIFTVTGVVREFPRNSHLQFEALAPFKYLQETGIDLNDFGSNSYRTFVELQEGISQATVDSKIIHFLERFDEDLSTDLHLQNIEDVHLYSSGIYVVDFGGLGDITYVRIFAIVAIFILLIACINFMNLSTAQSSKRAKEIGMRKVSGSSKRKIVVQFLGESIIVAFVALVFSMIIVAVMLSSFNAISGKDLVVNFGSYKLYLALLILVVVCGLLAGSYPALYLSSFDPLKVIKGAVSNKAGKGQFRRILVITQFSLTVFLIICTLFISRQIDYMQNKKLGLNKDNIGYFSFGDDIRQNSKALKNELLLNPDIIGVTMSQQHPAYILNSTSGFNWEGKNQEDETLFHTVVTDEDYATTFKIEMKDGRYFSTDFPSDDSTVVINEKAAEVLGFKQTAGKILSAGDRDYEIVGVVKDFHFKSVRNKIEPLIMFLNPNRYRVCFIRMQPNNIKASVDYIEKTAKGFDPTSSIDFRFLDDDYDMLYRSEARMGSIFNYFSILAIIISCLGLIGLSLFMAERRTKEIGIRKTNGAKTKEVFSLMIKEFISWVIISILIASPCAWFAIQKWTQQFPYHTNISLWIFVTAGSIALSIAIVTVSWQTFKAARRNPIEALRYE